SALMLFFVARIEQLKGNFQKAVEIYSRCVKLQNEWKQIHNICYWDLCWCHALLCNWKEAATYADLLQKECEWAPAVHAYQSAIFNLMRIKDESNGNELKEKVFKSMECVSQLRKRYAGKTFPPEKLAVVRSEQYLREKISIDCLLVYEYLYVWNILALSEGKTEIIEPILNNINEKMSTIERKENFDSYALLLLLKGVCLRNLGDHQEAIACFKTIFEIEKQLPKKSYVPAHAAVEMALTYLRIRNTIEARFWLEKAKHDYDKYLIEAVVHLRVHSATKLLKKIEANEA
ncbi:tetratricopeptide repeat protein 39B-like protein, partial [Dinothrombium tinctorium]